MKKIKTAGRTAIPTAAIWWLLGGLALAQAAETYAQLVASEESGGTANPLAATNPASTSTGEYQLTYPALQTAGFGTENANGSFTFNGTDGITSMAQFESSNTAQTDAFTAYTTANYTQLMKDGDAQYLGQTVNGQVINQAALLAGAQLLGPEGMTSYLANDGVVNNPNYSAAQNAALTEDAQARIAQGSQTDVSQYTGVATTAVANSDPNGTTFGSASAPSVNGVFCDPDIAKVMAEGSEAYIQGQQNLAAGPGTGFSLLNGNSLGQALGGSGDSNVGAGTFSQFSCLSNLLNGSLDVLFEPPSLSQLLNEFENAACAAAQGLITQALQPIDQSLYDSTNLGGFFPGANEVGLGSALQTGVSAGVSEGSQSGLSANVGIADGGSVFSYTDPSIGQNATTFFGNGLIGN